MNQRLALAEASSYVGVYRWGDGFQVYYPWKESDRRGARMGSGCFYWRTAVRRVALRKAELALWIYCEKSSKISGDWRAWFADASYEMHRLQEYSNGLTARQMLKIGIDCIKDMLNKYPDEA